MSTGCTEHSKHEPLFEYRYQRQRVLRKSLQKCRISRSEGDAETVLSNLPTITEDLKDELSLKDNCEEVFTIKRPESCENQRLNSIRLPPLFSEGNLTSRSCPSTPSCKGRPSTPRPVWTEKRMESSRSSRRSSRVSEERNCSETAQKERNKSEKLFEGPNFCDSVFSRHDRVREERCRSESVPENSNGCDKEFDVSRCFEERTFREACDSKQDVNSSLPNRPRTPLYNRSSNTVEHNHGKLSITGNHIFSNTTREMDHSLPNSRKQALLNRQKIDSNHISNTSDKIFLKSRRKKSC